MKWRRDKDYWLMRKLKPGDKPTKWWDSTRKDSNGISYSVMGFVCDGKVYAREKEHATAYDLASMENDNANDNEAKEDNDNA